MKLRFKKIYLEITNICNLQCSFCSPDLRPQGFMSFEHFQLILKRLKGWGEHLYFHLKGEPLIHPEIQAFAKFAWECGFKINLTTNGRNLGDHDWVWNSGLLRQLNISLHSWEIKFSPEWGDLLIKKMGQRKSFQEPLVNLRYWTGEKAWPQGLRELILMNWPNFSFERINQPLAPGVYFQFSETFEWPRKALGRPFSSRGFCLGLRDQIGILWDGRVVPCCLDDQGVIPLGNILTSPLEKILETFRAKKILEGFSQGNAVEALCQRCSFKDRFKK